MLFLEQVRSLTLDRWTNPLLDLMEYAGNARANTVGMGDVCPHMLRLWRSRAARQCSPTVSESLAGHSRRGNSEIHATTAISALSVLDALCLAVLRIICQHHCCQRRSISTDHAIGLAGWSLAYGAFARITSGSVAQCAELLVSLLLPRSDHF